MQHCQKQPAHISAVSFHLMYPYLAEKTDTTQFSAEGFTVMYTADIILPYIIRCSSQSDTVGHLHI